MNNQGFFYCYDPQLMKFLKFRKGINFICHGLHPKTLDPFWQFPKSDYLQACLNQWNQRIKTQKEMQNHSVR